jgi:hypothetical protein
MCRISRFSGASNENLGNGNAHIDQPLAYKHMTAAGDAIGSLAPDRSRAGI